jgi:hypothetical protein
MNSDPLPTSGRPDDRRSVLGIILETQDLKQESACLSQDATSGNKDQGLGQTGQAWTAVDHRKRKNYRYRMLCKKILAKRTRVE